MTPLHRRDATRRMVRFSRPAPQSALAFGEFSLCDPVLVWGRIGQGGRADAFATGFC